MGTKSRGLGAESRDEVLGVSTGDPLKVPLGLSLLQCLATVAGGCMAQPGDVPPLDGVPAAAG